MKRTEPLKRLHSRDPVSLMQQTENYEQSLVKVITILLSRSCYLVGTQRYTVFGFVTHIRTAD
jgi:hypothetical protein